eukprot:m.58334 g.58334  ORF g.58334 m.58334 type:complete len:252 (-) comp49139_c0_seq1:96-851(-)
MLAALWNSTTIKERVDRGETPPGVMLAAPKGTPDNELASALRNLLRIAQTLRGLDLSDLCLAGPLAFKALSELLFQLPHLAELHLSDCDLGDKHFEKLQECLRRIKGLISLDLSHNYLTDRSVPSLAHLLTSYPWLKHLYADGNRITEGPSVLTEAVSQKSTLREVILVRGKNCAPKAKPGISITRECGAMDTSVDSLAQGQSEFSGAMSTGHNRGFSMDIVAATESQNFHESRATRDQAVPEVFAPVFDG